MTQKERAYLFRKLTTEDAEIFLKASKEENLAPFILSTFLATTLDEAKEKLSMQEIYGLILFVGDEPARIVSALSIESDFDSGAQVEYFVSKEFRGKRFSAIGIRLLEQEMIGKTLSLLDKKIELQAKKIEDLKLYKKGLLIQEYNKITQKYTYKMKITTPK